ncbi:MAG: hypothetical protein DWP97_02545 [Calditrichaeota bacterium]|nr:MAG: hypothetical protein DWP97_02545 [Calditrichota bacterium]
MRTSLIVFFSLLLSVAAFGGGSSFIDLDGDGFDDNIIDTDNNGIPDEFQSKVKEVKSTGSFSFSPSSLVSSDNTTSVSLTLSESFSLLKFKCRSISKCRSNFESEFTTGLNVSSSGSSGCAGGVCF